MYLYCDSQQVKDKVTKLAHNPFRPHSNFGHGFIYTPANSYFKVSLPYTEHYPLHCVCPCWAAPETVSKDHYNLATLYNYYSSDLASWQWVTGLDCTSFKYVSFMPDPWQNWTLCLGLAESHCWLNVAMYNSGSRQFWNRRFAATIFWAFVRTLVVAMYHLTPMQSDWIK